MENGIDSTRRKILNYIYNQSFSPDKMLNERELALQCKVKRSYVREILLTMEGEGILERLPRRGYRFINYLDDDWDSIRMARYAIEHEAVRVALTVQTDRDLKKLEKIFLSMKDAAEKKSLENFFVADKAFHMQIVHSCRIKLLIRLFDFMSVAVFKCNRNTSYMLEENIQRHEAILRGMQNRNWDEAEQALYNHLGWGLDKMMPIPRPRKRKKKESPVH